VELELENERRKTAIRRRRWGLFALAQKRRKTMHVVLLQMRLRLTSRTLKEKRSIVKSILERARHRFNVACSESGLNDRPGEAELAFVTVADSTTRGRGVMQQLEQWLFSERPDLEVTELQVEEL
jgi:uncharacterized protein YlxP (DUF503 family)